MAAHESSHSAQDASAQDASAQDASAQDASAQDASAQDAAARYVLTVNGGSSSIKFAVYLPPPHQGADPKRVFSGMVDRIGLPDGVLSVTAADGESLERRALSVSNHEQGAEQLVVWLRRRLGQAVIAGVGHRVVHGGVHLVEHQLVTGELLAELKKNEPLDLAHLPREIALIEVFRRSFPGVAQLACFDTAF